MKLCIPPAYAASSLSFPDDSHRMYINSESSRSGSCVPTVNSAGQRLFRSAYNGDISGAARSPSRSEEHTSELQSLMRISYAVFCLKKKTKQQHNNKQDNQQQLQHTYTA